MFALYLLHMIIFYPEIRKATPVVSLTSSTCDAVCSSNCIKPKGRCCNKYKKKGVNCKRCPLSFSMKAVS